MLDSVVWQWRKSRHMNKIVPSDGMIVREDTAFEPGVYFLPNGITIASDGITLDGGGALLIGANRKGVGVNIKGRRDVTLRHLQLREYYHGIHAKDCLGLTLAHNQVTSTA